MRLNELCAVFRGSFMRKGPKAIAPLRGGAVGHDASTIEEEEKFQEALKSILLRFVKRG